MLKRNTSGLQEHAHKKRESAFERTEQAIQKLLNQKRTVNFDAVAKEAGVSRTWLYQQSDIRNRIEKLREQQTSSVARSKELSPAKQPVAASSEFNEIIALQQRIKKLERENLVLRKHLEVVYGLSDADLIKVIESLQLENEELKGRLQQIKFLKIGNNRKKILIKLGNGFNPRIFKNLKKSIKLEPTWS